ncbi:MULTISPECIES: GNAT family N-acetyltransferase [unclassified Bacillus (in: firmicutes)]|uniref:GNAT family N-acetyltransferase n=1 Tax=unclassified Bacillus (in: firmicutes) TaxID=185979 RepID=UPI00227EE73B|nr:GNAT family N-acetyltransferase [Bacillus sp. S20C3]MCY8290508.1 GNAT family N-acetyltransferase [Bacillus sp. N13C7]MCY8639431.1 GNAT family N-acetyltransferase [Bacillus sp. S17B2]MCY9145958.1 GNAT family N-acetyltransferase [Bacillus sp. T9C1]
MVTVREAKIEDIKDIAKVHVDSWRTTYRGIVPAEYLESLNYKEFEDKWKSRSLKGVFVAQDEIGSIFGFASFGPIRSEQGGYDGELYAIYLLEEHQRQGAGRALLAKGAEFLIHHGFSSMFVWVIEENPSITFYQAYTPERVAEDSFEIAGERLKEVGLGWPNLSALKTVLNR